MESFTFKIKNNWAPTNKQTNKQLIGKVELITTHLR